MAIKTRRKISWYKVARLVVTIMFVVVAGLYCYNEHNQIPVGVISQEEALGEKSVEEMREKYNARLQEKADLERHNALMEEVKAKRIAEQEAWLKAQQAKEKVRSEQERANFIKHRQDSHGPVTIAE